MITNQEAWKLYARYLEGRKAISDEQRIRIAGEVVAEDVHYSTPRHEWGNRQDIELNYFCAVSSTP